VVIECGGPDGCLWWLNGSSESGACCVVSVRPVGYVGIPNTGDMNCEPGRVCTPWVPDISSNGVEWSGSVVEFGSQSLVAAAVPMDGSRTSLSLDSSWVSGTVSKDMDDGGTLSLSRVSAALICSNSALNWLAERAGTEPEISVAGMDAWRLAQGRRTIRLAEYPSLWSGRGNWWVSHNQ